MVIVIMTGKQRQRIEMNGGGKHKDSIDYV